MTEEDGKIPFQVKKLPATETAIITKSTDPNNFIDGSKILSINGNRTIAMDYEMVKKSLASCKLFLYSYIERLSNVLCTYKYGLLDVSLWYTYKYGLWDG